MSARNNVHQRQCSSILSFSSNSVSPPTTQLPACDPAICDTYQLYSLRTLSISPLSTLVTSPWDWYINIYFTSHFKSFHITSPRCCAPHTASTHLQSLISVQPASTCVVSELGLTFILRACRLDLYKTLCHGPCPR